MRNDFRHSYKGGAYIYPLHHGGDAAYGDGLGMEFEIDGVTLRRLADLLEFHKVDRLFLEVPSPTWERYVANENKDHERTPGAIFLQIRLGEHHG
jgi:hypothetical protein